MHNLTILYINNKNEIFHLKSCPSPFKIITMGFGTSSKTYVALFDSWRVSKVTSVLIECKYYYNQQIHVLKKPCKYHILEKFEIFQHLTLRLRTSAIILFLIINATFVTATIRLKTINMILESLNCGHQKLYMYRHRATLRFQAS